MNTWAKKDWIRSDTWQYPENALSSESIWIRFDGGRWLMDASFRSKLEV